MFPPISPYTCITFNSVTNSKVAYVLEGKSSVGPSSETNRGLVLGESSSVFRGGGMRPCPPRNVRNRYTVKNGISNLYILLKNALKMQGMPFQRPKFQKFPGEHAPGPHRIVSSLSPPPQRGLREVFWTRFSQTPRSNLPLTRFKVRALDPVRRSTKFMNLLIREELTEFSYL